jgi:hypothetical protein
LPRPYLTSFTGVRYISLPIVFSHFLFLNVIPAQAGDKHPLQQGINSDFDPVTSRISGSRSQTSYRERLTKENYSVEVAEDGHVAEKMIQQQFFDVIITDLIMPGDIGGLEVLDIAKNNCSHSSTDYP